MSYAIIVTKLYLIIAGIFYPDLGTNFASLDLNELIKLCRLFNAININCLWNINIMNCINIASKWTREDCDASIDT